MLIISPSSRPAARPEAAAGFRVVAEAASGTEGLELFFRWLPDVVLLDVWLPDANGFRILEQIRAAKPTCDVVMLGTSPDGLIKEVCGLFGAAAVYYRSDETIPVGGILKRLRAENSHRITDDPVAPELTPNNFIRLNWP